MSSTKATYLLHQENKTKKETLSWAVQHSDFGQKTDCYIVEEAIKVDELDKGNVSAASGNKTSWAVPHSDSINGPVCLSFRLPVQVSLLRGFIDMTRQPSIEDDFLWKTTFVGRRHMMEDDLRWKTTFDGRWPLMEDDLRWKTTFDWRRPLMEDDLQ